MTTNQPQPPQPSHPSSHEPSPNQFGLRGMFLITTAICLISAAASWAGIREPLHLVGALLIVLFCALTIGAIEGFRRLFPDRWIPPRYDLNPHFDHLRAFDPPPKPIRGVNPFRDEVLDRPEESD